MKKVVIVTAGGWGAVKPEDYSGFIQTLKEELDEANEAHKKRRDTSENKYDVSEAGTTEDALKLLNSRREGILIFVSRAKEHEAEKIAEEHPRLEVFLFTGLIPEGRVRYIDKRWLGELELGDILA